MQGEGISRAASNAISIHLIRMWLLCYLSGFTDVQAATIVVEFLGTAVDERFCLWNAPVGFSSIGEVRSKWFERDILLVSDGSSWSIVK
jgi:hypothetical protein